MDYKDFLELAKKSIAEGIHVGEGSFESYKEYVESYKSNHSEIIDQYDLTESELFVMFMMLTKNFDEIQQCASSGKGTPFDRECVLLFDSFLSKIPRSANCMFYRVDKYQRIENFIKKSTYNCSNYLTASTMPSVFEGFHKGVKFFINRRLIGKSRAHEIFKIFNANNEFQVNFERNTSFDIKNVDKKNLIVELLEM